MFAAIASAWTTGPWHAPSDHAGVPSGLTQLLVLSASVQNNFRATAPDPRFQKGVTGQAIRHLASCSAFITYLGLYCGHCYF